MKDFIFLLCHLIKKMRFYTVSTDNFLNGLLNLNYNFNSLQALSLAKSVLKNLLNEKNKYSLSFRNRNFTSKLPDYLSNTIVLKILVSFSILKKFLITSSSYLLLNYSLTFSSQNSNSSLTREKLLTN